MMEPKSVRDYIFCISSLRGSDGAVFLPNAGTTQPTDAPAPDNISDDLYSHIQSAIVDANHGVYGGLGNRIDCF